MIKTELKGTIITIEDWKKSKSFKKRILWEYVSNIPIWLVVLVITSFISTILSFII